MKQTDFSATFAQEIN